MKYLFKQFPNSKYIWETELKMLPKLNITSSELQNHTTKFLEGHMVDRNVSQES